MLTKDCNNNNYTQQEQKVNENNQDVHDINVEEVGKYPTRQFICNNNIKTCDYLKRFESFDKCFSDDQDAQVEDIEENIAIVSILDCFHHLLMDHNRKEDTEYIHGFLGSCISKECTRVRRNYRIQSSSQTKLNHKQLFIRHTLDKIHSYFRHYLHNDNKEIVLQNNIKTSNNKFTSKLDHITSKLDLEPYSYSYPFNYWLHCKNITKPCFNGMTYSDLYIHPYPKYKNLEEELREHKVIMKNWLVAARCHMKTKFVKQIRATCDDYLTSIKHFCDHPSKFGYKDNSPIPIENICAILIYCGEDTFQKEFSNTYRPIEETETKEENNMDILNEIKSRHIKFYHFAKILKETIEVFGTQYIDGDIPKVYHGITGQMIIPGFQCKIFGPLSTTIDITIAQQFASGNGLVLELVPSVHLKYFNCVPISDLPWEGELLFIGGLESFNIQMIWKIDESQMLVKKYKYYIPALRMIDSMSNAKYFSNDAADIHIIKNKNWCDDINELGFTDVDPQVKELVQTFIEYRLSNKSNTGKTYIPQLLDTICNEKECVKINWQSLNEGLLEEVAVDGGYIGYGFIKPQICNKSNSKFIDIDKINKLFPNMNNLVVKELGNIESSFLDEIETFIKTNQNSKYCIELAVTNDFEVLTNINEQFEKYRQRFKSINCEFEMEWDKIWETNKIVITFKSQFNALSL